MQDEKYIVFKRNEFTACRITEYLPVPVADAVVIRCQDSFAGPALHSYAAGIALAIHVINAAGQDTTELRKIADYFHERAAEADATHFKLPD